MTATHPFWSAKKTKPKSRTITIKVRDVPLRITVPYYVKKPVPLLPSRPKRRAATKRVAS